VSETGIASIPEEEKELWESRNTKYWKQMLESLSTTGIFFCADKTANVIGECLLG